MKEKKSAGKIIAVVAAVVLVLIIILFLLVMCSADEEVSSEVSEKTAAEFNNDDDSSGTSGQKENIINGSKPYGDPDTTWTVMVYLCGTDLESENGYASMNLEEICEADLNDKVNVVIETGGTGHWQTSGIPGNKLSRFHVDNGEIKPDETLPSASMGDSRTLSDFISWGASEYPADRYMLLIWDHGGGSLFGVCLDELYDNDSLSLKEVENAIVKAKVPFEVAGFDACMMSSLETAEVFQGYAHYMVASQETEPGTGWDYISFLNYLSGNTGCSGRELGKIIVDSYMSKCAAFYQDSMATLAVSDLTKLPELSAAFRNYSGELVMATQDGSDFQDVVQGAVQSESYGERSGEDGTYNMVDLGDLMNNTGDILTEYSDDVLNALKKVVVYEEHGMYRSRASGLSVFYPKYIDDDVYEAYEEITDNTAYLEYANIVNGEWDSGSWETAWSEAYDEYEDEEGSFGGFFDWFFSSEDEDYYEDYDEEYEEEYEEEDENESSGSLWDFFFGADNSEESVNAFQNLQPVQAGDEKLEYRQYLDKDNVVRIDITSGLDSVKDVRFRIIYEEDDETCIYLGCDRDINADYDTGKFSDNFRGTWMTIGGEFVCAEVIDSTDDYDLYIIPAKVNGEETFIRAVYEFDKDAFRVLGTYDGEYEDTNLSGRDIHPLKKGDKIDFIFYSYDMTADDDEDPEDVIMGSIVWSDDKKMLDEKMGDGIYYYVLEIEDIFGNETDCDPIVMEIEDGEISAYETE